MADGTNPGGLGNLPGQTAPPPGSGTGAPGTGYTPGPGMTHDEFIKWIKGTGLTQSLNIDPEQAWNAYSANPGQWALALSGNQLGKVNSYPMLMDPAVAGIIGGGLTGGVGALPAAIGSIGLGALMHGLQGVVSGDSGGSKQQTAPQSTAQTVNPDYSGVPGYTLQNLQNYEQGYLMPALAGMNKMLQGDLSQWGNTVNNIMSAGGTGAGAIGEILKTQLAADAPIYDQLFAQNAYKMLSQPFMDTFNTMVAQQQGVGAKALGQATSLQTLLPYLAAIPGELAQLGISGGTPAQGTSSGTATNTITTPSLQGLLGGLGTLPISNAPTGATGSPVSGG